ncbi:MAG: cell wall metabolism sensor histidine kinase WalK [Deltaproteobacteria bacterium]|jgi:two-component system phosphate regulon sensor histidine kinase PhoR|nr:cell wall metabolism sensor histidine kinase WalK [Deltaproteobacteria bacterium]
MVSSPGSLRTRLLAAFALITLIAVALPAIFTRSTLYQDRLDLAGRQALAQAAFARSILEADPDAEQVRRLFQAAADVALRMTLTDASGQVLRDSHFSGAALPELDNHADRPEIEQALSQGSGMSLRHSNSLGVDTVYAAVRLKNGGALRVAVPAAEIGRSLETELSSLGMAAAAVAALCLALAAIIANRVRRGADEMAEIVGSIAHSHQRENGGGFRLRQVPGREFLPLAEAVNSMADSIEEYVRDNNDQRGQLESILDGMHEGVLVLNGAGQIRRWNNALAAMFPEIGRQRGKPIIEGLPVPALQVRVDALLANQIDDSPVYFELPAGRFLVAHLSRPRRSRESLGVIVVVYDATEIMGLNRIRRDFISNVSHELRTPLTAVRGYAETLLLADGLDKEHRAFATIIHNHATALSKIVGDLLVLARMENENERIELLPTDAAGVLAEAASVCREQAPERIKGKKITLDVRLAEAPVMANAALLAQVFRNLLENACRFTPENGVISVTSVKHPQAAGEVLFAVSDNGPGIPQAALPRIFERFYQVRQERNSGGSGVGLAICKHIIERHGGKIWAESPQLTAAGSSGAATAILFTLPAA